jgi:hypothetical protein
MVLSFPRCGDARLCDLDVIDGDLFTDVRDDQAPLPGLPGAVADGMSEGVVVSHC